MALSFLILNAILGLTILYSASAQNVGLVSRQAISFCIGFVVMLSLAQIPPKVYQAFSPYFYAFGVLSLLAVMIFGEVRMGHSVGSISPALEVSNPVNL